MKCPLSPSDIIEITGIITSLITSIVAIAISVKTLRQNSRMIEESSRPYISVYVGTTFFSNTVTYLIIKNFGASSAVITDFSADIDFSTCSYDNDHIPFEHIVGVQLCPSESIQFPVDSYKLSKSAKTFNIFIKYKSKEKEYCEKISVNFDAHCDRLHLRANSTGKHDKEISFALQDIAEKML